MDGTTCSFLGSRPPRILKEPLWSQCGRAGSLIILAFLKLWLHTWAFTSRPTLSQRCEDIAESNWPNIHSTMPGGGTGRTDTIRRWNGQHT
eukprot:12168613-Prorocentrum_lima.AAC.1